MALLGLNFFFLGWGAKIVAYLEVLQFFNDEIGAHHYVTSFGITGYMATSVCSISHQENLSCRNECCRDPEHEAII